MADSRSTGSGLPPTPGERLVRRTSWGLALFTLTLIAILLGAIGLVTAAAAVQITNLSVDSNLHSAAENMLTALAPTPTPTPQPSVNGTVPPATLAEPTDDVGASPDVGPGDGEGGGESENDNPRATKASANPALPSSLAPTLTPTPSPSPVVAGAGPDDRSPESADTFFLILDPSGTVTDNPQRVRLTGLPNQDGAAAAAAGHEDWRTITADGVRIRLLSEPMFALDGSVSGVLQSGFVLTAHDEQQALIVRTIVIASLIGLFGAAVVTLFVTRRAMSPIRAAFDAERRFVASASHELKTPVSVVRASAEILQREDLVKPEGRYLVDDVVSESDRLGRLVGDLLALASAQSGQLSISPTVFDVRPLINDAVERVQAVAAQRGVRVVSGPDSAAIAGSPDELLVFADRERMLQLLTIFIDNAIDHSPPNGVVRVVGRAVDDGSRAGPRVIVEVMDQGPGVPLAERERIFEPFARIPGQRRSSATGPTGTTGLGLAIARILAARQNATLAVTDAPGGGACFSVSLARRSPAQA